jgi:lysozyme family protein
MIDFERAIPFVIGWETSWGKAIRHKAPGEDWETMYGFSQRAHPEINFDTFNEAQAKAKFFTDYWERYGCDTMRWPANFAHMDCCVNVGNETAGRWTGRANKILQRALKVKPDGNIGIITLSALRETDAMALAVRMVAERQKYYRAIIMGDRSWADIWLSHDRPRIGMNLDGWLNRTEDLLRHITV